MGYYVSGSFFLFISPASNWMQSRQLHSEPLARRSPALSRFLPPPPLITPALALLPPSPANYLWHLKNHSPPLHCKFHAKRLPGSLTIIRFPRARRSIPISGPFFCASSNRRHPHQPCGKFSACRSPCIPHIKPISPPPFRARSASTNARKPPTTLRKLPTLFAPQVSHGVNGIVWD